MNIDTRIQSIMQKMEKLSTKHPRFTCGEFPPKWGEPLTEQEVADFEKEQGIVLPKDYRRFITTVAASGTQPFYGLYSPVGKIPDYEIRANVKEKFPCTVRSPLNVYELTEEAYEALYERNEPNVDAGIYPLIHPTTKQTMKFLDWLEYYVDKTLELDDEDYFGYAELAGVLV